MRMSFLITILLLSCITLSVRAEVTLVAESKDNKTLYRMDNGRVSLVVDPSKGGVVVSYRDKMGGDAELIPDKSPRGLCIDHFQSQYWPGEMLDAKYDVVEQKKDTGRCSLSLRYTVTGRWMGSEDEKVKDLLLEKIYTLWDDSPALECRIRITAPKKDSKLFAYWQQNIFSRVASMTAPPTSRFVPARVGCA